MRYLGHFVRTTHVDEFWCKLDACDRLDIKPKQPCIECENLDTRAVRKESYRQVKKDGKMV
jgi:hypothetical protein